MVWKICTKQLILKNHKILTKRVKTQKRGAKAQQEQELTKSNHKECSEALVHRYTGRKHRQHKILKRHGAHTSHRLKNTVNITLVKTTFRDLRHRLLDALLSACSPVEALLNLDDPKFKVNTPPVFKEHTETDLAHIVQVGTVSFTSFTIYNIQYQ